MATTNTHAAILCPPGMGHIIPALELAKQLVTHHITPKVTFFLATIKNSCVSQAEKQVLNSAKEPNLFDIIQLPPIDTSCILLGSDDDANATSLGLKMVFIMQQTVPLLYNALSTMVTPQKPNILITELFGVPALTIAEKLNMSKYVFIPSNAFIVALFLHTPELDNDVKGEYVDQKKHISIPGCKTIHLSDLFTPMLERTHKFYHEYLHLCEMLINMADGILVNTFHELEPKTIEALKSGQISKVPLFPIGPLIRETKENCDAEKKSTYVVDWLEKQEEESVIYVSLGSGYTMSYEQIKEMALGLELSGKKFVWSIRPPATKAGVDHYLSAGEDVEIETNIGVTKSQPLGSFPHELYRIQKMGLVVMDWAPQLEILRHSSIGGFVTHCGWNSVLESVSYGVPMVGWPLFADQRMNASLLAEETGIAIRAEVSLSTNMVVKEEIARAIRKVMDKDDIEGCAMRRRVKELKHIAESAWSKGGSALSEMASAFVKTSQSNGV